MNNGEILQRLGVILSVLNNIEVKGLQNLQNLAGAIGAINDLGETLAKESQPAPTKDEEGGS